MNEVYELPGSFARASPGGQVDPQRVEGPQLAGSAVRHDDPPVGHSEHIGNVQQVRVRPIDSPIDRAGSAPIRQSSLESAGGRAFSTMGTPRCPESRSREPVPREARAGDRRNRHRRRCPQPRWSREQWSRKRAASLRDSLQWRLGVGWWWQPACRLAVTTTRQPSQCFSYPVNRTRYIRYTGTMSSSS